MGSIDYTNVYDGALIQHARKRIMAASPHIETASDDLVNFNTDISTLLKECKGYFEPKQDFHGYDRPWVGGAGKNLLKVSADNKIGNSNFMATVTENGTGFNIVDSAVNGGYWVKVKPNSTYAFSYISTYNGNHMHARVWAVAEKVDTWDQVTNAYEFLVNKPKWTGSTTFTTNENTNWIIVGVYAYDDACNSYLTNIQIEEGSVATSYEPYENICPIEGWNALEVKHTNINLCENITLKNGPYYEWYIPKALLNQNLIFSMEVDNTNGTNEACIRVVFKDKDNITLKSISRASGIPSGYKARDVISLDESIPSNTDHIYFGTNGNNVVIADPMVKIFTDGNMWDTSDYAPYTGTTIPITFPAINMLDYIATAANKTISNKGEEANENGMAITDFIKANQGDVYTLTFLSKEAGRTRRIYGYDANKEPAAQLVSASWVNVGTTRSLIATVPSGVEYIRVCYKTADENIFLEGPESSTFYGGYVDLVNGEIVQTYKSVILNGGEKWNSYKSSEQLHFYLAIDDKKIGLGTSICDIFPNAKNIKFWDQMTYAKYGDHHTTPRIYVNAPYQMPGLVDEWKAYLADHPMHLVYELEVPIHYPITPETIKTLRGINNIWSTSNGPVTIKYWKH